MQCAVDSCTRLVDKGFDTCALHKRACAVPNCTGAAVFPSQVCQQHRTSPTNDATAVTSRHGKKAMCNVQGCERFAQSKGKCVAHGGYHLCKVELCASHARFGGLCRRHARLADESRRAIKGPKKSVLMRSSPPARPTPAPSTPTQPRTPAPLPISDDVDDEEENRVLTKEELDDIQAKRELFQMTDSGTWMFQIQI
ncbi:hypothetical protein AC1031_014352 [Aphanomyces cochlioides]|nr:hypothetical protein AC1031_014352 [Aphanomyces cochlioides]